jgi:uncharacterized membrane protein
VQNCVENITGFIISDQKKPLFRLFLYAILILIYHLNSQLSESTVDIHNDIYYLNFTSIAILKITSLSMTNTTMVTSNTSSFPDDWYDLWQSDQPLDMDAFLQSDLLAARRSFYMKVSIAHMISGPISFIASMLLVTHILRSHECLSSTYHCLVFGLSAGDIISSFGYILSSTMAPKEMSYLEPFASGNMATCDAQGFLTTFAIGVSASYNCSVCFYYLAIITYNKKFDYIEKKLEPWFHGISILIPLVVCVIALATNTFNGIDGGACYAHSHDPPNCIGYKTGEIPKGYSIPCGRGGEEDGHAKLRTIALLVGHFWVLIISPLIILVTMVMMYRSVTKIENRVQKYGVGSLRLRTTPAAPTNTSSSADQQEARGFVLKLKKIVKYLCQANHRFAMWCFRCPPCAGNAGCYDPEMPSRTIRSNKMASKKRAVLQMAFGYAGAWFLVWSPYFVRIVFLIVTKSEPDTVVILMAFMGPLQGFFNFVVFMAPKVRTTRTTAMQGARTDSSNNNNQNQHLLTWRQAFYKAYMDRGRPL